MSSMVEDAGKNLVKCCYYRSGGVPAVAVLFYKVRLVQ